MTPPPVGDRIKELRKRRGWTQGQLGEACGVSQSQVSHWEKHMDTPSPHVLVTLASLDTEAARGWWLELGGLKPLKREEGEFRLIPLLRDAAAAGTPRAMSEDEISKMLPFPTEWLPTGGTLHAVAIQGDSMEPTLRSGFIVVVDVDQRTPEKLVDQMVLAKEAEGLTVKWLKKSGKTLMLVPENLNSKNPVQLIGRGSDIVIVGAVVKWIGEPPVQSRGNK